jgi:hypothetical protein
MELEYDLIRSVLRDVLDEDLQIAEVPLANKWIGGKVTLKGSSEGMQEKVIPMETFFHKIVLVREKLRVLEQRINNHPKLDDADRVELQQYITKAYGSLTSFNVLFAERDDQFIGQKGEE